MADTVTAYGVWIEGRGWLRGDGDQAGTFASTDRAVAEAAAELWGDGARVLPVDGSLIDLQDKLLAHQAADKAERERRKGWWKWLTTRR